MTTTPTPPRAETEAMIADVLSHYPAKAAKFRAKHIKANDPEGSKECEVKSNIKSRPGVMTIRGCAYAGSKGVVWGPVKDLVTISHGPVGCGQYSWATRRNYARGPWGVTNFAAMQITTDFQEKDIVFGGDPKLEKVCDEINELFPLAKGISVQSECPIGLIGDDIEAVSRTATKKLGKPVIPVRCEGFRGVSQSLGHHIANDAVRDHVLGTGGESFKETPYDVALIGDYNIGGDAWASRRILEDMGLRVIAQWSGDGTLNEMASTHLSKLNLIHCYRSMNYICTTMEERYGTPWIEFNFFGPTKIVTSMRAIAAKFDETIQAKTEAAIARYQKRFDEITAAFKPRLDGKRVMLAVGGLRPRHTIGAYEDLGMEVVGTGYEFAHKDDYTRTYAELKEGVVLYDDPTAFELEEFAKRMKPDLMGAGVKEKYVFHKMGIPFRQMHSWDYSGPYHGVDGFAVFARDMDIAINSPTWDLMETPWSKAGEVF
ncbi:nitrogenase molybdenum-iron protein alpha chain [Parafrankia colletiae]|uniref:Nitrogenase protein alpha chain n=1 Tax=Parafrankia colletiae TaxID=573497 RepID=A0A1S1QPV0_9ACTN|nr:nitrogenase molybdenum-iron protein alpha chain [Parafrankia colletiae]MCK9902381.1 nitrogenase molybdenum-iron protein alpha chain [Frankia sp. Cpl3]OHV35737.1 nitrogenase molybdenum-iron protein alpha chain [Parafrankia colletiae]